MVSKKTRKFKQKSKAMTIPELKRAFDKVEASVVRIRSMSGAPEQIKEFQKVWRETFGKDLDKSAAEAYLKVKLSEKPKKGTRKLKKTMKGGAAPLAGAPLDYQTRPGIDGPNGSYPAYLTAGLDGYDKFNQFAYKADCGVKDTTPSLPAGLGSNQAGGAVQSSIPSSVFQDIQTAYSGRPLPASPAAEDVAWKYM